MEPPARLRAEELAWWALAGQGPARVEWNLLDDSGQRVAPAMYMMRVDIGDTRKIFPLVVIR